MNSKSLRRLAADHASLHSSPLPPNYFFDDTDTSDLTRLDVYLAGPSTTPFEAGLFRLHLAIPVSYPDEPPKAFFKTKIFHPNIDESTGAVCVETLKRDWDRNLTLRDVLLTINCLLLYPNPSSALNAEAGMLIEQEDGYEGYARRARFMTSIHAKVPSGLRGQMAEAQSRGEAREQQSTDDVFGSEQENLTQSASQSKTRDIELDVSDQSIEAEYPPSPKKSPQKGRLNLPPPLPTANLFPELTGQSKVRARRSVIKRSTRADEHVDKVRKTRTSPRTTNLAEETAEEKLEAELWDACGRDVARWNKGDFGGTADFKTPRW